MSFTFNWSQEMTYPDILVNGAVLVAQPGESYDLESAPDDKWSATSVVNPPEAQISPSESQGA